MFIGIDHGTSAMRFAGGGRTFRVPRDEALHFQVSDLSRLGPVAGVKGIALTYSMGDNFAAITPLNRLKDRGIISREGAGVHIGGGTRVFDAIAASNIPAVAVPGLHRGSPTDPRFHVYSHQASPEKLGIAYKVCHDLGGDVVIADVSSNTVSLVVKGGRVLGAIDACIFAPGTAHGAIDVASIRRIDLGDTTANGAFSHAGVDHNLPPELRAQALALFVAMECAALLVVNPGARVALSGSCSSWIAGAVGELLNREVAVYDEWCAAQGLSMIATDVFSGRREILGIPVDL
ncbi:MAG: methanogenesis marker 12 protein [Methanomicrobiales archaeon]|jgi:putative methanogenesis marker protein 12|nr:methanogenesis marker 12 protein [Methanomicrobiales archaeon]